MISFKDVTKKFTEKNNELVAVNSINITFNDNETTAIVGYSGAGKSTVVRLINGLIKPTSGSVLIDNEDITLLGNKRLNEVRKNIGMVFQHFNLLSSMTVYNNVKEALKIAKYDKEKINDRVIELLSSVDILDKKDEYPKNLSGGQKQRVGIARALANNPKYLLLDEATSALDYKTAKEIVALLKKIKQDNNLTIIFISHQIEVVKDLCDRIVVMDKGNIVEDDISTNIFTSPKHEVTKSLIESVVLDGEVLEEQENLYQIIYTETTSEEALLSKVIKKYDVEINIVNAKMVNIGLKNYGYLYVNITGSEAKKAINELQIKGLVVNKI